MISRQTDRSETKTPVNGIEVREFGRRGTSVRLSGEFDVDDLDALRQTLDNVPGDGRPTRVDLSGVTFLDVLCARELASGSGGDCGGRLLLRNPSWQAKYSLEACSLHDVPRSHGVYEPGAKRPASGGS